MMENNCEIILKSISKCSSHSPDNLSLSQFYNLTLNCDLPLTLDRPKQIFEMAYLLMMENNCAKLY